MKSNGTREEEKKEAQNPNINHDHVLSHIFFFIGLLILFYQLLFVYGDALI